MDNQCKWRVKNGSGSAHIFISQVLCPKVFNSSSKIIRSIINIFLEIRSNIGNIK